MLFAAGASVAGAQDTASAKPLPAPSGPVVPASTTTPQLEIWYYNQPYRRFVFADREGFGRFTLVSPTIE